MAFSKDHEISNTLLSDLDFSNIDNKGETSNFSNAYHRIERLDVTKNRIDYKLVIYNENLSSIITEKFHSFIPDVSETALNYHTQCYDNAKSLEEYEGFVDC